MTIKRKPKPSGPFRVTFPAGEVFRAAAEVEEKLQPAALERNTKVSKLVRENKWVPIRQLLDTRECANLHPWSFSGQVAQILDSFSRHVTINASKQNVHPMRSSEYGRLLRNLRDLPPIARPIPRNMSAPVLRIESNRLSVQPDLNNRDDPGLEMQGTDVTGLNLVEGNAPEGLDAKETEGRSGVNERSEEKQRVQRKMANERKEVEDFDLPYSTPQRHARRRKETKGADSSGSISQKENKFCHNPYEVLSVEDEGENDASK